METAPTAGNAVAAPPPSALERGDLPYTFQAAATTSEINRKKLERYTGWQLVLFCAAAASGGFTVDMTLGDARVDVAGLLGVVSFLFALILGQMLAQGRYDETWQRTRDAAEVVESLAWRYAVGGAPYGLVGPSDDADAAVVSAIGAVTNGLRGVELAAAPGNGQMTPAMATLRAADFAHRRAAYARRLETKRDELAASGREGSRKRALWESLAWATLALGLVGAVLKVLTIAPFDALGAAGAVAAAATAWIQTKRFRDRAAFDGGRAGELADAIERGRIFESEWLWSEHVQATEETVVLARNIRPPQVDLTAPARAPLRRNQMSWDQFYRAVDDLDKQIRSGPDKFDPDVILAVNPGGAIVGGLLYFLWHKGPQFVPISYRHSQADASAEAAIGSLAVRPQAEEGLLRILVIDASQKSGLALRRTLDLIARHLPEGKYECRTAVLVHRKGDVDYGVTPTYCVDDTFEAFPYGPV